MTAGGSASLESKREPRMRPQLSDAYACVFILERQLLSAKRALSSLTATILAFYEIEQILKMVIFGGDTGSVNPARRRLQLFGLERGSSFAT